jgi:hypothetical protein
MVALYEDQKIRTALYLRQRIQDQHSIDYNWSASIESVSEQAILTRWCSKLLDDGKLDTGSSCTAGIPSCHASQDAEDLRRRSSCRGTLGVGGWRAEDRATQIRAPLLGLLKSLNTV